MTGRPFLELSEIDHGCTKRMGCKASTTAIAVFIICELDEFHRGSLQSEDEDDLIHGLLSVVFWDFRQGWAGGLIRHAP